MKRIVVVDDNPASRELIREVLDQPGHTILEASDGRQALELISQTNPDLVLLDIQLPGMDGYTVVRHLRADPRFLKLRVLAVTAFAMHGDRERALAAGFDGYITKPIDTLGLEAQVEEMLQDDGCY